MENRIVFKLSHIHEHGEVDNEDVEIKELGLYSNHENALLAIERYFLLPGFKQHPKKCFLIEECTVDEDSGWLEGFISSDVIAREFEIVTSCFNDWLGIKVDTIQDSWNDNIYHQALCEVNGEIYNTKDVSKLAQHIYVVWKKYYETAPIDADDCKELAKSILISLDIA